jgi:hypothetical protein
MNDFDDKMKERWQQHRKKAYNWPKLLLMVLAVVAIFYVMNRSPQVGELVNKQGVSVSDSMNAGTNQADTLQTGTTP